MLRTLSMRKHQEAERRAAVPQALADRLGEFAALCRGRFIMYGSLAKGLGRHDSDIDLLLDFPAEFEAEAWRRAEATCAELNIEADIKPLAWCDDAFLERALAGAKTIP